MLKVQVKYAEIEAAQAEEGAEPEHVPGQLRVTEIGPNGKPQKNGVQITLDGPGDFQEVVLHDGNALLLEEIQPGE